MEILKNLKDFFVPQEDGDDEFYEEGYQKKSVDRDYDRAERTDRAERDYDNNRSYRSDRFDDMEEKRNKVVNIQATAQLQVVLVKPEKFQDSKQIADHLIAKKTVVLNLENSTADNRRRIIDFLVGVAYANGGTLKPVANQTYIITPYNVGFIGGDLVDELESNGVII
ncbi:MAG: cell division protein SepF [Oscillospiraceae bacterium]|nr:cell division protein SepF [Oscillospiraceae bacterium]